MTVIVNIGMAKTALVIVRLCRTNHSLHLPGNGSVRDILSFHTVVLA
jgi:hypothetical protein